MYEPRTYRHWVRDKELVCFNVVVKETDLHIYALSNLHQRALELVIKYRSQLELYTTRYPAFLTSLEPVAARSDAPQIVRLMCEAGYKAGVGPMASVAGAVAEFVGKELLPFSPEIIVENGGDIFMKSSKKRYIGIYAGKSPLTGKIGLEIEGRYEPYGICTSSGTVGHSLSFGKADAAIVLSRSAILADAVATAVGNLVAEPDDIPDAIKFAKDIAGITGVVIIIGEKLGAWGDIKICPTSTQS